MNTNTTTAEDKRKHLEFLQGVINRMAANSFLAKGWSVTLVAALFVLSAKDANTNYVFVALIPITGFWILDGFFISQERLFRALYDQVRTMSAELIDYSMDTKPLRGGKRTWGRSIFSRTLIVFYVSLVATMVVVFLVLK